jgi:hypothetical protein
MKVAPLDTAMPVCPIATDVDIGQLIFDPVSRVVFSRILHRPHFRDNHLALCGLTVRRSNWLWIFWKLNILIKCEYMDLLISSRRHRLAEPHTGQFLRDFPQPSRRG